MAKRRKKVSKKVVKRKKTSKKATKKSCCPFSAHKELFLTALVACAAIVLMVVLVFCLGGNDVELTDDLSGEATMAVGGKLGELGSSGPMATSGKTTSKDSPRTLYPDLIFNEDETVFELEGTVYVIPSGVRDSSTFETFYVIGYDVDGELRVAFENQGDGVINVAYNSITGNHVFTSYGPLSSGSSISQTQDQSDRDADLGLGDVGTHDFIYSGSCHSFGADIYSECYSSASHEEMILFLLLNNIYETGLSGDNGELTIEYDFDRSDTVTESDETNNAGTYTLELSESLLSDIEWVELDYGFCSDTDGGKDYLVQSTTTGGLWSTTEAQHETHTDRCIGETMLTEYYCKNDVYAFSTNHDCSDDGKACLDGACVDCYAYSSESSCLGSTLGCLWKDGSCIID